MIPVLAFAFTACTRSGEAKAGDCLQNENNSEIYLVTQAQGEQLFGYKYDGSEQGNETTEIDRTEKYRKVECPDVKLPSAQE